MSKALVINLYGGPGVGKSTTAAKLFALMKDKRYNVELVTEYAKDLTWEKSPKLGCGLAILGEQYWRMKRLESQVDFIITDSPLLLNYLYDEDEIPDFALFVENVYETFNNLDVLIKRPDYKPYNETGRNQSAAQAVALDEIMPCITNYDLIYEEGKTPIGHIYLNAIHKHSDLV